MRTSLTKTSTSECGVTKRKTKRSSRSMGHAEHCVLICSFNWYDAKCQAHIHRKGTCPTGIGILQSEEDDTVKNLRGCIIQKNVGCTAQRRLEIFILLSFQKPCEPNKKNTALRTKIHPIKH